MKPKKKKLATQDQRKKPSELKGLTAKPGKFEERTAEFWEKHAQPQLAAAQRMLEKLTLKVGELERLPSFARHSISGIELVRLANRILRLTRANLEAGRTNALDALPLLVELTRKNCQTLRRLADDKRTHAYVKAVASRQADWPVVLSTKKKSRDEAGHHLKSLFVGTRTLIPTAGMNKQSEADLWNQRAAGLIRDIEWHRQIRACPTPKNAFVWFEQAVQHDAEKWAQVLKLPAELNSTTYRAWWKVAKKLLEIELDSETPAAKLLLDKAARTAARETESQRTIAIREVCQAFRTIARNRGAAGD